jgi:putative endonuclease
MSYYVYIATNKSGTLYVGMTNNIERRAFEHEMKANPNSFTARYNINILVFAEEFAQVYDAISAEKKVKGWNRKKKLELIKTINPEFRNLLK